MLPYTPYDPTLPINFPASDQSHAQIDNAMKQPLDQGNTVAPLLQFPAYCLRCLRSGHQSDQCPEVG